MRRYLLGTILLVGLLLASTGAAAAAEHSFRPGSAGLGDPFFPQAGNGGYDVTHYGLVLDYNPAHNLLGGTVTVSAKATQDLSRFDLDLRGFVISRLLVNGRPAAFARDGQEVVVTPPTGLQAGRPFTVTVDYRGTPSVVTDPDDSIEGWVPTDDGAFVVCEPQGAPAWFPCNDTPRDKATFDFAVTVPKGLTVMANGVLVSHASRNGKTTWVWHESDLMATYLTTATLGRFDLTQYKARGIPVYVAVDSSLPKDDVLAKLPAAVDYYISIYGPYPFNAVGAVVDSAEVVGYSLETQTKPVFDQMPDEATLVHELAHMWLGDSVTLTQWPDIWLHEGFATFSEWLWTEHEGGPTAQQRFDDLYATSADTLELWNPPPGNPGEPAYLFSWSMYDRGAMTLQALRDKLGDKRFFKIMRLWAQQNRYGNVTTAEFISLCERTSGHNLRAFFQAWLYREGKPTTW
jgi:aminopeptidase N